MFCARYLFCDNSTERVGIPKRGESETLERLRKKEENESRGRWDNGGAQIVFMKCL